MIRINRRPLDISVLAILLNIGAALSAHAELGPQPAPADQLWFSLVVQSPIRHISDYTQRWENYVARDLYGTTTPEIALELRRASDYALVGSVDYNPLHGHDTVCEVSTSEQPNPKLFAALGTVEDGNYVAAFVSKQKRISNVAPFQIDSVLNVANLSPIELIAVEPPPFYDLPLLGLRVYAESRINLANIHFSTFYHCPLLVDGNEQSLTVLVWGGMDPQLKPGDRWLILRNISGFYRPIIKPGVEHKVALVLPAFTTEPALLSPLRPLGNAWDTAVTASTKTQ